MAGRGARGAGGDYAGQRGDITQEIFVEASGALGAFQIARWDAGFHNQNVFGMISEGDVVERDKALDEQSGAYKQHETYGNLGYDKRAPKPVAPGSFGRATAALF